MQISLSKLLTDAEQRTESAQSELRSLRSTVEQLRSDHEQERERREIAEELGFRFHTIGGDP